MTTPGVYQLFVYGSLRSGFHSPVYEYISSFFTLIGEGKVKGSLYDMGSYPAGIATHDGHFIVGELYRINQENEFAWAIGQLDDYEGVTVEANEIQLYRREITDVHLNNSVVTPAWIYWYNGDVSGRPVIASGDMLEYINQKNS